MTARRASLARGGAGVTGTMSQRPFPPALSPQPMTCGLARNAFAALSESFRISGVSASMKMTGAGVTFLLARGPLHWPDTTYGSVFSLRLFTSDLFPSRSACLIFWQSARSVASVRRSFAKLSIVISRWGPSVLSMGGCQREKVIDAVVGAVSVGKD